MSVKTEEIIDILSKEFQVSKDEILNQSIKIFIERRLREIEIEILNITKKYNVKSVEEIEERYKDGSLSEAESWKDYQRLDHLEYYYNRLKNLLESLK